MNQNMWMQSAPQAAHDTDPQLTLDFLKAFFGNREDEEGLVSIAFSAPAGWQTRNDVPSGLTDTAPDAVAALNVQATANVYYCAALMAVGTSQDRRSRHDNLAGLCAIVVDLDDAQSAGLCGEALASSQWPGGLQPSMVVRTSASGEHPRYQLVYLLDEPAVWSREDDRATWRNAAAKLRAVWRADNCTIDPAHYWRLPGLVNWPDARKQAQGRVPEVAELVWPDRGELTTEERRNRLIRHSLDGSFDHLPEVPETTSAAATGDCTAMPAHDLPEPEWTAETRRLWEKLRAEDQHRISDKPGPQTDRSEAVAWATRWLTELGASPRDIFRILCAHSDGPACRFWEKAGGDQIAALTLLWTDVQRNHRKAQKKLSGQREAQVHMAEDILRSVADGSAEGSPGSDDMEPRASSETANANLDCGGNRTEKGLNLVWLDSVGTIADVSDFVENLLTEGTLSCLYGDSGTGKTFCALNLAAHVATGIPWHGREIDQGSVLYVALEGGATTMNRLLALRHHLELSGDAPLAFVQTTLNLRSNEEDLRLVVEAAQAVKDITGHPLRLLVIDTLSRAFGGGEESSPVDMGQLVQNVDAIRKATEAHVMLVHHTGKDHARGARGHSLLRAAVDTEIEVSRQGLASRKIRVTKQRDLPEGDELFFTLKEVQLGLNHRGKPVTSSVAVPSTQPPKSDLSELPTQARRALDVLRDLQGDAEQSGREDHSGVNVKAWREKCAATRLSSGGHDAERKAFKRAQEELTARRLVELDGDAVWAPIEPDRADMSGTRPSMSESQRDGSAAGHGHPPKGMSCPSGVTQGEEGEWLVERFNFADLDLTDAGYEEATYH